MFDPDEFWTFADELLNAPEEADECACRVAAGRAYYAIFLTLKRSLGEKGIEFSNDGRDHSRVVRSLKDRHRDPLANAVNSLLRLREKADYDLDALVDFGTVSFTVNQYRSQYANAKGF